MRIFGIPLDSVTLKDQLDIKDKKLQGLSLEKQIQKVGLDFVQDENGKFTVGIRPLYPWNVTTELEDMQTQGKAKKYIAKRLGNLVEEKYDDLKQMADYYDI